MKALRNVLPAFALVFCAAMASAQSGRYGELSPKWAAPAIVDDYTDRDTAMLSLQTPMLQWTMPVVGDSPVPVTVTYNLRIVEAMPGQDPLEAIERNPVAYQLRHLMAPQCLLPAKVIRKFSLAKVYVAQVTAQAQAAQQYGIGRSLPLIFRVIDSN